MAMQSRRDLYQAHRLMTTRAALALMRGEPDVPDQPIRRMNVGTLAGVLVGVIVVGIFGIWGLLFHGSAALKDQGGTVIIDKQTGAAYVFCQKGKDICPVVNYASALLDLQSSTISVQNVNQSALTKIPHGPLIGILGLPPDLPAPGLLFRQPWAACVQTLTAVAGHAGPQTTTVLAGGVQPGGQRLGSTGLLLVSSEDTGQDWVIGNGQRMLITPLAMKDLFPSTSPVTVTSVWLNALPQGGAFAPPAITDQGTTVTGPTGTAVQVGELYQSGTGAGIRYYVTMNDGSLASITQTQESLLILKAGDLPPNTTAPPALSPSQLTGHVSGALANDLPLTDTNVVSAAQSAPLCVVLSGSGSSLSKQVETGGQMPVGTKTGAPADSGEVDQLALPPGKGALVQEAGSSVSYLLITDGHRYALASTSVPSFLGYSLSQAVQLPAGFLDMIPAGPGFSPAQATQPVPGG
jgi:type VII secretion protein EccB